MKKILIALGIVSILFSGKAALAEDPLAKYHTPKNAGTPAAKPVKKPGQFEEVSEKVDNLLKGQDAILQQLEEIKSELYIVKIRATKR